MGDRRNDEGVAMNPTGLWRGRSTAVSFALGVAAAGIANLASAGTASATPASLPSVAGATAAADVTIRNFSFQPALLIVKAGTRVTWTNEDTTPHTVTSSDKAFASSAGLDTQDQYSYVFEKPGTYRYFCSLHPMMVGKVTVEPLR